MQSTLTHLSLQTIILCFPILLVAQMPPSSGGKNKQGPKITTTIKGQVIDGTSDEPLEYATITLLSNRDSSVVTGGITDLNGNFRNPNSSGKIQV